VEEGAHRVDEAVQRVGAAAVGAHVLDARQALLDEAEDLRRGLALAGGGGHRDLAQRHHHGDLEQREHGQRQADPGVLEPQHHQDAGEQQQAADHAHGELGEEVAERGDVAVDALDHLARGAGRVEGHVERQAVLEQVAAQQVGGGPADRGAEHGRRAAEQLGPQRDGEEHAGEAQPARRRRPRAACRRPRPVAVSMKRRRTCGTSSCRPMPASSSTARIAAAPAWGAR
jgi:hypothetical protein